jgi:hypothetical protein
VVFVLSVYSRQQAVAAQAEILAEKLLSHEKLDRLKNIDCVKMPTSREAFPVMITTNEIAQRLARGKSELRGRVLIPEGADFKGLSNVLVEVIGTNLRSKTDEEGRFNIDDLPFGTYELKAIHPAAGTVTMRNVVALATGGEVELRYRTGTRP